MTGEVRRRPRAEDDLVEIWVCIARHDERAADQMLDRIERVLRTLAAHPLIGRARPELAPDFRSFPIGSRIAFYRPSEDGIDLIRVLGAAMDIGSEDVQ